jgi:hypothetical protein
MQTAREDFAIHKSSELFNAKVVLRRVTYPVTIGYALFDFVVCGAQVSPGNFCFDVYKD